MEIVCEKVRTAIEVIETQKNKRTLTKGEIVMLFQQVVSDLSKQGEKMTNLEKRMESLESKMDAGFADIKKLIEDEREKKKTFWDRIPLLKEIPTWFWIILWTVVIITGALLGVSPDFIQYIKTGG